jgi:protein ImuA
MQPQALPFPAGRFAQAAALLRVGSVEKRGTSSCAGTSVAEIDEALPWGGLPTGLHEIASPMGDAAGTAFAVGLIGRRSPGQPVLWCRTRRTAFDSGNPYGPGISSLGIDPGRLILVEAAKPADLLWAMEEGARTRGLAAVVAEAATPDLTASRRLQLAAEAGSGLLFLLQPGRQAAPSTALSRWFVSSVPSLPDAGGPGRPRWKLELWRCRGGGRPRAWMVEWDDETLSLSVVPAFSDRSLAAVG